MDKTDLLRLLADGELRSGQELAELMGVSRTAVWKQLQKLEGLGIELETIKGAGYRLPGGLELLDETQVRAALSPEADALLQTLSLSLESDSTNAEAMRHIDAGAGSGWVFSTEQQSAGRGRRGRDWVSPFGRNLYVSVIWSFDGGAAALEGLSLAVGVAVARALDEVGMSRASLKWPNDILVDGAKLGGILLEMSGDAAGPCSVVVGVGLNVAMPDTVAGHIEQSWTDATRAAGRPVSRNALLAALLNHLLPLLSGFAEHGFTGWREPWLALDAFAGEPVVMLMGERRLAGIARGVDDRGALQLETGTGVQSLYGGEISLRPGA